MSINNNNNILNEILETINDLPEAGSGKEEQEKTVDITENGTTEVMPDEGKALSKVIVNVGVASSGEGLPDWDDDSPIIASGYGYGGYTMPTWEVTERGTMRWIINPNGFGYGVYATTAGWDNTITPASQPVEYMKIASKVRQIYVGDGFKQFYIGYAINCERVRLPSDISKYGHASFNSLKEVICSNSKPLSFQNNYCMERILLSPDHTTLSNYFASNCYFLKEINLENVIKFGQQCFEGCVLLELDITFSAGLESISNKAFYRSGIKSITFQTPTGSKPTISTTAFSECRNLDKIRLFDGWDMDLYAQDSPLTQECLHDIAEKYADMTGAETAPVLRLGTANINKMDAEHIAMLENKNINYS